MAITVTESECTQNNSCKHSKKITDNVTGEEICYLCGQILAERLENSSEAIFDIADYRLSRTGQPNSLAYHDGLSTIIDYKNTDAFGKNIPRNNRQDFSRLRLWDSRTKLKSSDRSLMQGLLFLDGIKKKLVLPERTVERIAYIYRKASALRLARGRRNEQILTACVFVGCKQEKIPRSLQEISSVTFQNKQKIVRTTKLLIERLGLRLEPVSAADYLSKIASATGMSNKAKKHAYELLKKVEEHHLGFGKNPVVLCGAIAWIASAKCGDHITQQAISGVAGITPVSIRNHSRTLIKMLSILTDDKKEESCSNENEEM